MRQRKQKHGFHRLGAAANAVCKIAYVQALLLCLMFGHLSAVADPGADHDDKGLFAKKATPPPKPIPHDDIRPRTGTPGSKGRAQEGGCAAQPGSMANFANGESYDFKAMVSYLTAPACAPVARDIAQAAISSGINFSPLPPFRLEGYANSVLKTDLESAKRTEMMLSRTIPPLLRENPLSSSELLPLLGQLALLSPRAAKSTLANLIQQELYAGDQMIRSAGPKGAEAAASDLARTLVKLGAGEGTIASEMAESIEDMALMAQADSLGKIFRALSAAASVEASLVPTFNLSAGALNRGIQRGKDLFVANDKTLLTGTVFTGIKAALSNADAFEAGATELNEALGALMGGTALQATALKKLWKDAVKVLATSTNQTALAEAVALSLTPQMIFLLPDDMGRLLSAAKNYPEIAGSIQTNFLAAWDRIWRDLHDSKIKVITFNRMKEKYFEPLVAEILELDPYLIDSYWLREVLKRGLIRDEDIEKRFPRLVLAYLERRDKATRTANTQTGLEPTLSSMAENFAVLWALSNVHVPALMKWVKKYEQ